MVSSRIDRRALLTALGGGAVSVAGCVDAVGAGRQEPHSAEFYSEIDGTVYDSLLLFRNDDPAPWTKLETLQSVTDIFIERDIPMTHSVVPYDSKENERLDSDHGVSQYLNKIRTKHVDLFDIVVHGYSHRRETEFHGGSEFGGLPRETQADMIDTATEILDKELVSSNVFAPPYNTYDETTVEVLVEEGFSLVTGSSHFQNEYFGRDGLWNDGGIVHLPANLSMENWETETVRPLEELKRDYDRNKAEYGLNVVMFHYYFYADEDSRQRLEAFVEYATKTDDKLLTLNEFAEKMTNEELAPTEDGWIIAE